MKFASSSIHASRPAPRSMAMRRGEHLGQPQPEGAPHER
jgi:hypothetical protein